MNKYIVTKVIKHRYDTYSAYGKGDTDMQGYLEAAEAQRQHHRLQAQTSGTFEKPETLPLSP